MNSDPAKIYIAVIDDDDSICRSMSRLLRAAGYEPIAYLSAEEFLQDRKHPQFDCLLIDTELTGMSGFELRKRLSAVGVTTPVIFITAQDGPSVRMEAEQSGCAGFFRKVDEGKDLLGAIQNATTAQRE